jgi:lysozyme family protein
MATIELAMPFLKKHEGGWSNRRQDRGGPTMEGLTLAVAQRYGIMTEEALRNISDADLMRIYRDGYWKFDGVNDQRVATKMFDLCVNFGDGTEIKMIQVIVGVSADGVYGPATEAAINAMDPDQLIQDISDAAVARYEEIEGRNPNDEEFMRGWLIRAKDVPDAA